MPKKTGAIIYCKWCGKEFYAMLSKLKKGQKYCSKKCCGKDRTKSGRKLLMCKICKKKFSMNLYAIKQGRKYCSRKCYAVAKKEMMLNKTEEQSNGWNPNTTNYYTIHTRIQRSLGNPNFCEICWRHDKDTAYEWANKDHKYRYVHTDWFRLCKPCHKKYDIEYNNKEMTILRKALRFYANGNNDEGKLAYQVLEGKNEFTKKLIGTGILQ